MTTIFKKIIFFILIGFFVIVTLLTIQYINKLKVEKEIAKSLTFDYIKKEYSEQDTLKLKKICKPILGRGDYQMVITDNNGEIYYLFVKLTRDRELQWVDDMTKDVQFGTSVFPCGK